MDLAAYGALGGALSPLMEDAHGVGRAKVLRWLDGSIVTRTGKPRRDRVRSCGWLFAARRGDDLGLAHRWCRDRVCPGCMARRQSTESAALRAWVQDRQSSGAIVLFVTHTQVKQALEHETCGQAVDRLLENRRATFNTKTSAGRALRKVVTGGVFFTEVTWSYAGMKRGNGGRVAYSGWHAHAHGLVELAPPPGASRRLGKGGVFTRLPRGSAATRRRAWVRKASTMLVSAWLHHNPEGSEAAQKVVEVDGDARRVGQVCKYPLKPFEVANPDRQREACLALAKRRTNEPFGGWRSWKKEAARLPDVESKGPPIELGDCSFRKLMDRASHGSRVYFDTPWGDKDTVGVAAETVLAAFRRRPVTLQRQAREDRQRDREETAERRLAERDGRGVTLELLEPRGPP